ncbi:hypothetical protein FZC84_00835 [Rossellomorea vietnamensis]|uniref:Uncharacterized protein n=1 Tax=Rossellomorea vietnamensis TaxID=218284 RepID=A0A5D4MHV7_9BACI|nr:hypothetical protein [Rossellomorea vietnamensis]TYS01242.1 hypothetical protein FZC84_00835 [Rossellomorea vietnamensis]
MDKTKRNVTLSLKEILEIFSETDPHKFVESLPTSLLSKKNSAKVSSNPIVSKLFDQSDYHLSDPAREAMHKQVKEQLNKGALKDLTLTIVDSITGLAKEQIETELQNKLKDLPFNINIHLNVHQQQNPEQIAVGHVNHGAVAIKDSNAVDHPVNSSVAQAHSSASDNPANSSLALNQSAASDNPDDSAVSFNNSNSSDNPTNSSVSQDHSASSDNPNESAVSLDNSKASDNPS